MLLLVITENRERATREQRITMSSSSKSKRSSTMPRSLLSLPSELQQDIIRRTPAEDLLRAKSVCKGWNALINNLISKKKFIYEHVDHSSSSSQRFLRRVVDTAAIIDPVTQRRSTLPLPDEFQGPNKMEILIHCDGLVLCRRIKSVEQEIAIWNPMLREVRWIEGSLELKTIFGVGYKNRSEGYKILSFPDFRFRLMVTGEKPVVRIYDLEKASWRILDKVKVDWELDSMSEGVAAMGNMYWLAQNKKKDKRYIQAFDFTAEAFKDVCLCPPLPSGYRHLSCFSNDRLSLLHQEQNSKKIEVWVSNKLSDESVSFALHFSVPSPDLPQLKPGIYVSDPVYCFVKPTSIVAWCVEFRGKGYCTALYEIDKDGLKDQSGTERNCDTLLEPFFFGNVYVPSFV